MFVNTIFGFTLININNTGAFTGKSRSGRRKKVTQSMVSMAKQRASRLSKVQPLTQPTISSVLRKAGTHKSSSGNVKKSARKTVTNLKSISEVKSRSSERPSTLCIIFGFFPSHTLALKLFPTLKTLELHGFRIVPHVINYLFDEFGVKDWVVNDEMLTAIQTKFVTNNTDDITNVDISVWDSIEYDGNDEIFNGKVISEWKAFFAKQPVKYPFKLFAASKLAEFNNASTTDLSKHGQTIYVGNTSTSANTNKSTTKLPVLNYSLHNQSLKGVANINTSTISTLRSKLQQQRQNTSAEVKQLFTTPQAPSRKFTPTEEPISTVHSTSPVVSTSPVHSISPALSTSKRSRRNTNTNINTNPNIIGYPSKSTSKSVRTNKKRGKQEIDDDDDDDEMEDADDNNDNIDEMEIDQDNSDNKSLPDGDSHLIHSVTSKPPPTKSRKKRQSTSQVTFEIQKTYKWREYMNQDNKIASVCTILYMFYIFDIFTLLVNSITLYIKHLMIQILYTYILHLYI